MREGLILGFKKIKNRKTRSHITIRFAIIIAIIELFMLVIIPKLLN